MWEVFVRNKKASVPGNQIHKQTRSRVDPENAYWFSGTEAFVLSVPDKEMPHPRYVVRSSGIPEIL